jgi:hypothetical protein
VPVDELGVVAKRGVAVLVTRDDRPQLVAELDPEVEGGPNPLGGQRDALARRVPDEEDPVLDARPELVRDPVALVANRRSLEVVGEQDGGVLDVEARIERAHADPLLIARGEAPAVAGRDIAPVDPDLEIVRVARGMDLEPA